MSGKSKSKSNTSKSKSKSSKSKSKDKKDKKSSKDSKKKSSKSKDKSKKEKKSKIKEEKEGDLAVNDEKEKNEKNLIQNLTDKNNLNQIAQNNASITFAQKCEGCFQGEGALFCAECGKIYCKTCDDQFHVIPAYNNHERIPLETFSELKVNCHHHDLPLRLFCETCHEPICKECQRIGPHNTQLHAIGSLFGVYKKFIDIGKNYLNGPLKEKSFKIEELMIQIDNLLNENKDKAKEMLHGISLEYENIIENIIKIDGNKKAELSFNASELQKDIINIQNILDLINKKNINYFNSDNGGEKFPLEEDENDKIINFLLQYKSLVNDIDMIISKPTNKILTKEDEEKILKWPKELNDTKEKLLNYQKLKKLLKVKDDIIWKLLTTPYEERNPELLEVERKTNEEIAKWTQLIEKTKLELSKYNLVCHFCGIPLEHGMNTQCPLNINEYPYENKNLTGEIPPQNYIGMNRHFFSDPTEEYQRMMDNGQFFDVNGYMRRNNFNQYNLNVMNSMSSSSSKKKKDKDIYDLMRPSISSNWVHKSARIIEDNNINLFQILTDYDTRGGGYVTMRELLLAFAKIKIVLNDEDKESLKKYLMLSGFNEDKIDIKTFAQNFGKTSTYFDPYASNENKNRNNYNPFPQESNNGFRSNNINMSNFNNNNYCNSAIQRSLNNSQINPMMNSGQGFSYSSGIKC